MSKLDFECNVEASGIAKVSVCKIHTETAWGPSGITEKDRSVGKN
jgi:hypothetical protein